jgi:peptidoglycan/LPS O-acetylase OafA/YrhL
VWTTTKVDRLPAKSNGEPLAARRFFSGGRFSRPGLTGLRALAAWWVVAFHLNALAGPRPMLVDVGGFTLDLTPLLTEGWVGVNLFFVLSGFLLTVHLLERRDGVPREQLHREYLWARIRRVVPAYWAQLLVLLAMAVAAGHALPHWAAYVPVHLAFLQNTTLVGHNAINGVYWTLPVEFTFYLVLPFLVARLPKSGAVPPWLVPGAIALAVAWRLATMAMFGDQGVPALFWSTNAQFPGLCDQFAWGIAAGTLYVRRRDAGGPASDLLWVAGLLGLLAWMQALHRGIDGFWSGGWIFYAWHPLAGACIAAMVYGVACGGVLARAVFENRLVLALGLVSYSTYLWHFIVAAKLLPAWGHAGLLRYALVAVPAIVLVSAVSFVLTERPFLRQKARFHLQ